MTKDWTFDQPLDDKKPTPSTEERAKIAALFAKNTDQSEELDYVAAFEMTKQKPKDKLVPKSGHQEQSEPKQVIPSTITNDYKQHLTNMMARNNEDIVQSQKKIEELHQLIDDKNKHNKKLQAISVAIDDL